MFVKLLEISFRLKALGNEAYRVRKLRRAVPALGQLSR